MSKTSENQVTATLTFKVPQNVGWSIQRTDQSWAGDELAELVDCLAKESGRQITLSVSLIFELTGNEGTVRSSSEIPPEDG